MAAAASSTVGRVNLAWAAGGALAGLAAGPALRRLVYELSVPGGVSAHSGCGVDRWLCWVRARCRHCDARLGTPAVLELATAVVLAAVLGRLAGRPEVLAYAVLGVLGVALAAVDIAVRRLPDRLTLPAYPVIVALFAAAAVATGQPQPLLRALAGGVALVAGYLALALLRPGQLGGGDIKLAGLLGVALAWLGWPALLAGAALGFVLAAVFALVMLAARQLTLRSEVPFGPFMLLGALLVVVL